LRTVGPDFLFRNPDDHGGLIGVAEEQDREGGGGPYHIVGAVGLVSEIGRRGEREP